MGGKGLLWEFFSTSLLGFILMISRILFMKQRLSNVVEVQGVIEVLISTKGEEEYPFYTSLMGISIVPNELL